ncbi:hypothetical protein Asppvi_003806 [Aspergillus pseudoviridinutans]|uniref:Uncharacterized protein n=1 Tax=Aspergillus pseudoviridinutans TaxID=1517512 RepID=A0A9P3BC10_9EURO|nr:uncharacterized protein Asppvi_003806 [Aspergillus pseudoviridinutans]GIJ84951.1 hypothetical protein Asppvi_003806 [Aspergillus pseudoviridinutans]
MSDRISRWWVDGKEGSKLAPRQNSPSSAGGRAPLFQSDDPSGINQTEDAFTYREEIHQLALKLVENGERSRPPGRALSGIQRKETDQIVAQITDIQGQLKEIREQNSARDSYLKQVWDHVRKLNQWAAEAREIINGKSLPSPDEGGSLDV